MKTKILTLSLACVFIVGCLSGCSFLKTPKEEYEEYFENLKNADAYTYSINFSTDLQNYAEAENNSYNLLEIRGVYSNPDKIFTVNIDDNEGLILNNSDVYMNNSVLEVFGIENTSWDNNIYEFAKFDLSDGMSNLIWNNNNYTEEDAENEENISDNREVVNEIVRDYFYDNAKFLESDNSFMMTIEDVDIISLGNSVLDAWKYDYIESNDYFSEIYNGVQLTLCEYLEDLINYAENDDSVLFGVENSISRDDNLISTTTEIIIYSILDDESIQKYVDTYIEFSIDTSVEVSTDLPNDYFDLTGNEYSEIETESLDYEIEEDVEAAEDNSIEFITEDENNEVVDEIIADSEIINDSVEDANENTREETQTGLSFYVSYDVYEQPLILISGADADITSGTYSDEDSVTYDYIMNSFDENGRSVLIENYYRTYANGIYNKYETEDDLIADEIDWYINYCAKCDDTLTSAATSRLNAGDFIYRTISYVQDGKDYCALYGIKIIDDDMIYLVKCCCDGDQNYFDPLLQILSKGF